MSRRTQLLIAVVFCAVLSAPGVLMALGARPGAIENRALTGLPNFGASTVLDDETYEQVGQAFTDRLPLRGRAIRVENEIRERLTFGGGTSGEVVSGRDGWLYLPDTLVDVCPGPPSEIAIERADRVQRMAAEKGVPFLFSVVPDKALIYQEVQGRGLAGALGLAQEGGVAAGCSDALTSDLEDAAADRDWLLVLAGRLRHAAESTDVLQYWKRDTHWTSIGSLAQTEAVVDTFEPGLWNEAEVSDGPPATRVGDLARLRGSTREETGPVVTIQRPGVTTEVETDGEGAPNQTIRRSLATTDGTSHVIPGVTLLIGDSFAEQSWSQLQPYFEELVFVNRAFVAEKGLVDHLDAAPDRIIYAQATRNIGKGWYEGAFPAIEELLASM